MVYVGIEKKNFGVLYDGNKIDLYTVSNGQMSFSATNFGCTLTNIILPAAGGKKVDILLGRSTLEGYASSNSSFGALVGRIANRVGGASFLLNGREYKLDKNDGDNCLHGGFDRFEKKLWKAKQIKNEHGIGVEFKRMSLDGEQRMPGNLQIKVIYTLNEKNELRLEYFAKTDAPTPVNLTNHAYFNLKGWMGGSVEDLQLQIASSRFIEVNENLIPTGKLISVDDQKPFDFREAKLIGRDIANTNGGYDHAFCIDGYDGNLREFAHLKNPASGCTMSVSTTLPACQIYTGNFLDGIEGKNGFTHHARDAVCMETEMYPDAPNHADFPSCIVYPEKPYHEITVYKFGF